MPVLKFVSWMWLDCKKQILSIFFSSFLKVPTVRGGPQNQNQRQRGAEEKRASKRGNQKLFHKFVSQRVKHTPVWSMTGNSCRSQNPAWCATRTSEHFSVALCPASGGLEICISAEVGTDDSRNRRASGLYTFNFPFIHHLNVLKPIIKEIISIKSSILPSVMGLFLINLICPWCLSGDNVS